jgi:hypothetical protein
MRSLEERLSGSLRPGARPRGNVALDILTGRNPDHVLHSSRPYAPDRPRLASAGSTTYGYLTMRAAARAEAAPVQLRIARPLPRRRSRFRRLRKFSRFVVFMATGLAMFAVSRTWQPSLPVPPAVAAQEVQVAPAVAAQEAPAAEPTDVVADLAEQTTPEDATAVPTEVPATAVAAPANRLRVLVDEHFAFATGAWPGDGQSVISRSNGAYRLRASHPTQFVGVGLPGTDNMGDIIVTASFHKTGGPTGGGYGLIVRDQGPGPRDGLNQDGQFYVFEAGDDGRFGVWLRDHDHWVDLLTWTPTDAIKPGTATNELSVTAIGDRMTFLLNSVPVASEMDNVLHSGGIGIFTGGDGNEIDVEHITVRVPS